ncbi:hypothetical protein MCHI_003910 [Candidatus Magnetoovum chiemensis]|nr:hypothetical protein MCHI_003910 [Candidatus Magnetoovum chiemensis]
MAVGDFYCDKSSIYGTKGGKESQGAVCHVEEKTLSDMMEGDFNRAKSVWLPRQDQFQEILNLIEPKIALDSLTRLINEDTASSNFLSMEQLWLAIYMKYKHGKYWNNSDWA